MEMAKSQYGERFPRYVMERMFARFLNGWIQHKARARPLSADENQRVAWTLGVDLQGLTARATSEQVRLEVHAVRPTVRLRADGRSKVELLIILGQRIRVALLADPADPASTVKGPDGTPLSFWFRGGATLIVDPEAGAVTYSVAKNILSRGRQGRQMAFLRNQLAREGSVAITRFGLTDATATRQRRLEPFALAHASSADAGTY